MRCCSSLLAGNSVQTSNHVTEKERSRRIRCQLWKNWVVVFLSSYYLYSGWSITLPSLYQYMTNPSNTSCGHPGLESSDTVYSIAAGIYSGGEIIGALTVAWLTRYLGHKIFFVAGILLQIVGFLIYGLSTAGWMVILARLSLGINGGIIAALPFSYYGKSAIEYHELSGSQDTKMSKERIKNRLVYVSGFVSNSSYTMTLGTVMILTQFTTIEPFRWVAWYQICLGMLLISLAVIMFQDPFAQPCSRVCFSRHSDKNEADDKDHKQFLPAHQRLTPMVVFTIIYVMLALYNSNSYLSIMESLANPILSDYFGLSVDSLAFFFLGVASLVPLSCLVLILLDFLHIDSRIIYVGLLFLSTTGLLLLGDWQTLGSVDQCNNFSITDANSSVTTDSLCGTQSCAPLQLLPGEDGNSTSAKLQALIQEQSYIILYQPQFVPQQEVLSHCPPCSNQTGSVCLTFTLVSGVVCTTEEDQQTFFLEKTGSALLYTFPEYQTQLCVALTEELFVKGFNSSNQVSLLETLLEEITSFPFTAAMQSQHQCKAHSGPPYYCYWNQDSLVTGKDCPDCPPLCRSTHKIPHYVQVFLSVGMLTIVAGACVWVLGSLLIKVTPARFLPMSTGITAFFQALARLTTPIWGTAVYVVVGRRTVIPIAIVLIVQIPVYIGLGLTWKRLKDLSALVPSAEESQTQRSIDNEDNEVEVEFDAKEEEIYQMYSVQLETPL